MEVSTLGHTINSGTQEVSEDSVTNTQTVSSIDVRQGTSNSTTKEDTVQTESENGGARPKTLNKSEKFTDLKNTTKTSSIGISLGDEIVRRNAPKNDASPTRIDSSTRHFPLETSVRNGRFTASNRDSFDLTKPPDKVTLGSGIWRSLKNDPGTQQPSNDTELLGWPENSAGVSDGSTEAGLPEFSAKDEYILRRSSMNIPDMSSKGMFSYSNNWDTERGRLTPDSSASSSKRFFTNSPNGKIKEYSVSGLRDTTTSHQTQNDFKLAQSTRQVLAPLKSESLDRQKEYKLAQSTRQLLAPLKSESLDRVQNVDTRFLPSSTKNFEDVGKEKPRSCFSKFLVFAAVLILGIGGLTIVIITQSDSEPDAQSGTIIEDPEEKIVEIAKACLDVNVKLKERIGFLCTDVYSLRQEPTALVIKPPLYVNKGENIYVLLNSENQTEWMASLDNEGHLNVTGPLSSCNSPGTYKFTLTDQSNASLYSAEASLKVISEVLQVNVTLTQDISNSSSDFIVGCSTHSGCEDSFVDFFAEINQDEHKLAGVNFTCTINYNYLEGYSVSCVGIVPEYLMSQFEKITCRPRSNLLLNFTDEEIEDLEQVLELPECDISKHCGYKCQNTQDYFVVNSGRCDIFHRCHEGVVYTQYCAPKTFFDPQVCACRHTTDLNWCQQNGALKEDFYNDIEKQHCSAGGA